jgi:O-methyltransferase involved in polyketide biosynthesis
VEKLKPEELRGVSETLLIPLHYRVEESRKKGSTFRDEIGERFHDAIAYDWALDQEDRRPERGSPSKWACDQGLSVNRR